jgi:sensor histidine kinase regulating citrate/malate metabolism
LLQFAMTWVVISHAVSGIVQEQMGQRALQTAIAVAEMPEIRTRLAAEDQSGGIQTLAEDLRRKVGAEYIVVADRNGVRYSHPVPERIGKTFVGGDTAAALTEGRSYISQATGTLGPAIRGFSPIHSWTGDIIGFVSVGYLVEDVRGILQHYLRQPALYVMLLVGLGILWAIYVARTLKKRTLGLEPEEITQLYLQRRAVLQSIREGVVAIDEAGVVRLANRAALAAAAAEDRSDVVGKPASSNYPDLGLEELLRTGGSMVDEDRPIGGRDMLVNAVAVEEDGRVHGAVATFRPKDAVDRMARELVRVQGYVEALRAQSHEHSNMLHMIAGLLEIGAFQEAQDLVFRENSGYQQLIRFLHDAVPHPVIAAIILGKYARARELRVDLSIAPDSQMIDVPAGVDQERLVTVLGNLLDNAFDAVSGKPEERRKVLLSFTDLGDELVFDVEDSGDGVPPEQFESIFEKGVSSKGGARHGYGLFLVRRAVDELGGYVTLGRADTGGALFTVAIPKYHRATDAEESGA